VPKQRLKIVCAVILRVEHLAASLMIFWRNMMRVSRVPWTCFSRWKIFSKSSQQSGRQAGYCTTLNTENTDDAAIRKLGLL